jgi:hypothetical protein
MRTRDGASSTVHVSGAPSTSAGCDGLERHRAAREFAMAEADREIKTSMFP